MQGKGLIKVFLVLITLVCLLQFWYFIPTNRVEKEASEYALNAVGNDESKVGLFDYKNARARFLDSISSTPIFSIPLIKSYTYTELKKQQLALGLDLSGGMSTVLEVDLEEFIKTLAGRNSKNAEFVQALESAKTLKKTSQSDFITLFVDEYRKVAGPDKLGRLFARSEMLGEINTDTDDGVVTRALRSKANETVNLTFKMLKERIDKLGVAQPNISLDAPRDLILVEMPGIDNPERARQYLQASAQLEFWETYRNTDAGINQAFQEADRRLTSGSDSTVVQDLNVPMDSIYKEVYDDLGNVIDSTLELVPRTTDPLGAKGGLLSALILNSGTMSPSVMGVADKNQKKYISEVLERPEIKSLFPKNARFVWSYKPSQDENGIFTNQYELYLIKTQSNTDKSPLDGEVVTSAVQTLDPVSGQVEVNLRMNAAGAKKWAEMTTKAANDGNREIAIVLDNEVVSAPRVNGPITGGSSSITGNFSVDEAVDFANILEVGKLPAKTKIIQESNVGPSLGKANIKKSINSMLLGFSLVMIFMVLYYAGGGIVAILSLLLNVFLIFGTLSSFGTVLTLSGIAGIVLTIGMAVDANVIIYERIKEELRSGKNLPTSIADGFSNSYSAIIDANVTTILTAMVLAYFGLGPVKGFAIVLIIGVLCSVFTALLVSRLMIDWWIGKKKNLTFSNKFSQSALQSINVDWLGKRKIAYGISATIIIIGLISIFTRGFDLGVDYKGGFSYNIQFSGKESISSDQLRNALTDVFGGAPVVKQVDVDNTYNVTTSYLISDGSDDVAEKVSTKLHEGIVKMTGSDVSYEDFMNAEASSDVIHVTSSNQVGPTIADDLKKSSFYAGIFALLVIFLYLLLRFSKWQYSFGAIAAVFHDAFIVLGLFSLLKGLLPFSLELDQAFIAAILTVIGYSINDTVIVFDRIREFMGIHTTAKKEDVINMSINTTLSRTLLTSGTTLLVIVILLIFGGASIKGFAFALFVGILVGTYSSIFIAAPIVNDLAHDLRVTTREHKPKTEKSFSRSVKD
ncbi:MAG: protein translocase subunit SecDF [Saprospiraceae bacterium]|nr:protein translocase subunit SecDF [Saprospiraceae bacterium]